MTHKNKNIVIFKQKETHEDRVFGFFNTLLLVIFFIIVLYPLIYVFSSSFSSADAIIQGRVKLFPVDFSLEGYKAVFSYHMVLIGYGNSFFYTLVGTLFNLFMTIIIAYPLSRKDLRGKGIVIGMLIFTMMFNAGLIPNYLLIKNLGMLNTRASLIIPQALNVFNVMITITFFKNSLPDEIHDAAIIDGVDDFGFLLQFVIPLSKAIIAVIALYYAVGHWNEWFNAMIYLKDPKLSPLQLVLRDILVQNQMSLDMMNSIDPQQLAERENLAILLKYGLIVVASVPLLLFYPFVQKYFVKGVMIGSVKG